MKKLALEGKRFGEWVVLKEINKRICKNVVWLCQCQCGIIKEVAGHNLKSGDSKSCGCHQYQDLSKKLTIHGHTLSGKMSRTYSTWQSVKSRCLNPNHHKYKYYGGMGVKICERWMKFENFLKDMGEKPKGLTIHRINPFGNYNPRNCKWADYFEQNGNRRSNWIEFVGKIE